MKYCKEYLCLFLLVVAVVIIGPLIDAIHDFSAIRSDLPPTACLPANIRVKSKSLCCIRYIPKRLDLNTAWFSAKMTPRTIPNYTLLLRTSAATTKLRIMCVIGSLRITGRVSRRGCVVRCMHPRHLRSIRFRNLCRSTTPRGESDFTR